MFSRLSASICFLFLFSLLSLCFQRHEIININLRNKPDWYYTKHPFGQIPVLENSQCQLIYDSIIACEYLDDAYPGRKLFPHDPYERARQKMLLELFCKVCVIIKSHSYSIFLHVALKFQPILKSNHLEHCFILISHEPQQSNWHRIRVECGH